MRYRRHNSLRTARARRAGFTLIEAALTTVIIGVGFMAMLQLLAAGTASNIRGAQTTTGMNLAKNIREMSLKLPFDQLTTLNGVTHAPPVDSRGVSLGDTFKNWTQVISVQAVDPNKLTFDVSDETPDALRITVRIMQNGTELCQTSWYAFDGTP